MRLIEYSLIRNAFQAPFVVHLHYAFQTENNLVLILDFVNGGELFKRMRDVDSLTEQDARFYISEVRAHWSFLSSLRLRLSLRSSFSTPLESSIET